MGNTEIRLVMFSAGKDGEALQSAKTRPGADCGSDHHLLIAKFKLKLKIVGKTTGLVRYNLNHIPEICSGKLEILEEHFVQRWT